MASIHDTAPRPLQRWWIGAIPVALVVVAFIGALGTDQGLFYRDHSLFFRPEWWSIYAQLSEGALPVLNLSHPLGQPHEISTNYALFTPLTLVLFLGPFSHSYDAFVVAHFATLALGAYLLARDYEVEPMLAAFGATISALVGPIVSFDSLLVGLSGFAFAPWVWLTLRRLIRAPSGRRVSLFGLATACAAQGLMPEVLLLHLIVAGAIAWESRDYFQPRTLLLLLLGGGLSALMASVDIVPQIAALSGSARWEGFDPAELVGWRFGPYQFVELVAPAFWASPNLYFFNVPVATGSAMDPPYLPTLYLGIVLPIALGAPMIADRWCRAAAMLAVVFLLVSTGPATPLHGWLTQLPVLRSGRFAIKYFALVAPLLAFLAIAWSKNAGALWTRLATISVLHAAVLVGLLSWLGGAGAREWLETAGRPFGNVVPFDAYKGDVVGMALGVMKTSVSHALAFSGVLVILMLVGIGKPKARSWLALGVMFAAGLDLATAAPYAVPLGATEATRLPAHVVSLLREQRSTVMVSAPGPVPDLPGHSPFQDHLRNQGASGHLAWDLYRKFDFQDLEGMPTNAVQRRVHSWLGAASPSEVEVLLRRAGVGYCIGPAPGLGDARTRFEDQVGRELVLSRVGVGSVDYASLHSAWLGLALTSSTAASVFRAPDLADRPVVWGGTTQTSVECAATLAVTKRDNERRGYQTRAECPTLLLLREHWSPRWRVVVDGHELEPTQADAGFLSVTLASGRHEVEFFYDSLTRRCLPWSGLGLALALVLFVFGRPRRQAPNQ